jgi:hypothetical protein
MALTKKGILKMSNAEIRENVVGHLAQLGDSPAAIAASLTRLDCKGQPGEASRCPIATYLTRSGFRHPSVSQNSILINSDAQAAARSGLVRVTTPEPVAQFLNAFDSDDYPELVADPARVR